MANQKCCMRKPVWGWSNGEAQTRGDRCCTKRILSRQDRRNNRGWQERQCGVRKRIRELHSAQRDQMDVNFSRCWSSAAAVLSRKPQIQKYVPGNSKNWNRDVWICSGVWFCTYLIILMCLCSSTINTPTIPEKVIIHNKSTRWPNWHSRPLRERVREGDKIYKPD